MEKQNKVSIWLGNFESEDELSDYMKEQFTSDGDIYSDFMEDFEIDFIDNQFQEVFFSENLSKEEMKDFSYAESYVNKINYNLEDFNSVIALYNFNYEGTVTETNHIKFVGVFDYKQN